MLDMVTRRPKDLHHFKKPTSETTSPTTVVKMPLPVRRHVYSSLAQVSHLPPDRRAYYAALYVRGELTLRPNIRMAAMLFHSYAAVINDAIADIAHSCTAPEPVINRVWDGMSSEARDAFVRKNLPELWSRIDAVTTPNAV